jgi:hypothetical protein
MENMNQNNEGKIKKVLYNEVSFAIAIVSLVSGLIFWVTNPGVILSQRVSILESDVDHNNLSYQQTEAYQTEALMEIRKRTENIENRQIDLMKAVARLEAR